MSSMPSEAAFRKILAPEKSKIRTLTSAGAVMAILMAAAFGYWLWFGLTQRSINGPDILSMTAVMGILEHGVQQFPSGYLYHRGYVPHYLVAGAIKAFGFNDFSIMLPSVMMALGTLWLAYLIAKDILGRPWLGAATAGILLLLQVQTFYATSPRMYMALEFFTILAVYSAWRGYIRNDAKFRAVTFLAIGAAILAHQEGAVLIAAIPVAILAVILMGRGRISAIYSSWTLIGIAFVGVVVYFQFFYSPPGMMPSIAYDDGRAYERTGLHLDIIAYGKHFYNLERAFPYGLSFIPLALFIIFKAVRERRFEAASGPTYILLALAVSGLLASMGSSEIFGTRLWLFVLPLYVLIACLGGAELLKLLSFAMTRGLRVNRGGFQSVLLLLSVGVIMSLGAGFLARDGQFLELVQEGYGPSCQHKDCDKIVELMYENLRQRVGPDDVIVSSRPPAAYYYLGRVDVLLRDKTPKAEVFGREEHFGALVIDSIEELKDLGRGQRIWVIADANIREVLNEEVYEYLDREYVKIQTHELMTIYTNSIE